MNLHDFTLSVYKYVYEKWDERKAPIFINIRLRDGTNIKLKRGGDKLQVSYRKDGENESWKFRVTSNMYYT